ncbi:MAG: T9SS type A sorting domain-containing protein [Vicingus serpentipes]|nr:T9SS type A sorting domain-containing protein [Vicingus serpentipes]
MKKILLLPLLLSIVIYKAQTTAIPDANFEQALIDMGYDAGTPDGVVLTANIDTVSVLDVSLKNISSLTGIEDFTALKELSCYFNNLSSLNVSQNTALTSLYCVGNYLTSLDVSQNIQLVTLTDSLNSITEHDLSNNINLTSYGGSQNDMTCLNLKNGNNINMTYLSVNQNLLSCIEVDNPSWANSNWTVLNNSIDIGVSFSSNCNNSCSAVSINEQNQLSNINTFPNPTSGKLSITLEGGNPTLESIRNSLGQLLLHDNSLSGDQLELDLSTYPTGIYFLQLNVDGQVVTKKIIKH